MRSICTKGWLAIAILFLYCRLPLAQDVVQDLGITGVIDWTNQLVKATGTALLNPDVSKAAQKTEAIETAKVVALKKIVENIKNIRIDSETTVGDVFAINNLLKAKVKNISRNFVVNDIRDLAAGGVGVDVSLLIIGALSDLLLPENFGGGKLIRVDKPLCPFCGQPWPEGKMVPDGINLIKPESEMGEGDAERFTGVLIDARDLHLRPALAPRIFNESGEIIYGHQFINRTYAIEIGIVGYTYDINSAREDVRIRNNPLVIKAIKTFEPNNADVMISNIDAIMIHAGAANLNFLERCRVVLLIDKEENNKN